MQADTIADVIDLYLAHTRSDQSERVYLGRKRILRLFAETTGRLNVRDAKPWHLRLWVDSQTQWKSNWTRKGVISTVQRCFNWSAKLGIIGRNPFHGVSQPEGEPGRPMTDDEFRRLLRSASVPFRRVLIFLRFTGCRPCELAAIQAENVDLQRSIVTLAAHKTARQTGKPRVIVLHPTAHKLIRWLLRNVMPDQDRLFINARGRPWTRYAIACRMKRLRSALKLPAESKVYGLRHKFGTDAIRNKVEIKSLSVLMGHASTRTTERYVHIADDLDLLRETVIRVIGGK